MEAVDSDHDFLFPDEEPRPDDTDPFEVVIIEDKNLELCMKKNLAIIPEDPITVYHMNHLTSIDCYHENYIEEIASLGGLEYAENLRSLSMNICRVKDLSPIRNLGRLRTIRLIGCSDLTDEALGNISHIPGLETIDFSGSSIQNLQKLRFRRFMTDVTLKDAKLSTTEYLMLYSSMQRLIISGNRNLRSLEGLELWETVFTLDASDCSLDSISGIANLHTIEELDLSGNRISSVSVMRKLRKLRTLDISGNIIQSITPLETVQSLQYLDISDNSISDISALVQLRNLIEVNISQNCIALDDVKEQLKKKGITVIDKGQNPEKCK